MHFRCCEHCAEDGVHQNPDGSQINDTHLEPCDVLTGPWQRCKQGRRVTPHKESKDD